MNTFNWCTCAEFNARTKENYERRLQAEQRRRAERQARADRYYRRIRIRHTVRAVATDLGLITAMVAGMFVLLRLAAYCL